MSDLVLFCEELRRECPDLLCKSEEPLCAHTSFRIGGAAERMVFPNTTAELATVLRLSKQWDIKPIILGAGTNVLAPDEGLRGLVICTRDSLNGIRLRSRTELEVTCGVTLARAAMFACEQGLSGLEFAHGIPGTVGGGIYMNAGAYGGELQQVVQSTEVLHMDGSRQTYTGAAQGFAYRHSAFMQMRCVIVSALLQLQPAEPESIRARMRELSQKRRASQPLELPSAGSTFKRPVGAYAAALIEQAGLKGLTVGGAAVSEKHAGFVVNLGGATARDVLQLIALVQERVYRSSGIHLEPEIRILKQVDGHDTDV